MSAQLALPLPWDRYGWPHTREPLARSSDPGPSHDAAAAYLPHAKAQQAQIHAYLIGVGPGGATAKEIGEALGYGDVRVSRRIAEMRDAAMVSTYNGGEDVAKRRAGPGNLAPLRQRAGCCVHVARCYARKEVL